MLGRSQFRTGQTESESPSTDPMGTLMEGAPLFMGSGPLSHRTIGTLAVT
jgi:hypothetical protein